MTTTTFVVSEACSVFKAQVIEVRDIDGVMTPVVNSNQSALQTIAIGEVKSSLWQFSTATHKRLTAIVENLNDQVAPGFWYYLKCDIPFAVSEEFSFSDTLIAWLPAFV